VHHSDRGSQYASESYSQLLARHGIEASMSRAGDCYTAGAAWPRRARARTTTSRSSTTASACTLRWGIAPRRKPTLSHRLRDAMPRSFQQSLSLPPLDPLLPGALPPDRRAAPQPAEGRLRAAPLLGKGEPFPRPLPLRKLRRSTSIPVSDEPGRVSRRLLNLAERRRRA
jgi:hypothetical protein